MATYNRADCLEQALSCLTRELNEEIEIVVVDGASTANTESVVSRYGSLYSNIRYNRLPAKGGVDCYFDLAVEVATGAYCWLMADDDLDKPGAPAAVLKVLERRPSLVVVKAEVWISDFTELIEPRRLRIFEDRTYSASHLETFGSIPRGTSHSLEQ